MKGQICNIYQENIKTWVGVSTGKETECQAEFMNLETGDKFMVDFDNEVGELVIEDIFNTAFYCNG